MTEQMSDVEWIEHVRKYAFNFGGYTFSRQECTQMLKFLGPPWGTTFLDALNHQYSVHLNLVHTVQLMDDLERGIVVVATRKLTAMPKTS